MNWLIKYKKNAESNSIWLKFYYQKVFIQISINQYPNYGFNYVVFIRTNRWIDDITHIYNIELERLCLCKFILEIIENINLDKYMGELPPKHFFYKEN